MWHMFSVGKLTVFVGVFEVGDFLIGHGANGADYDSLLCTSTLHGIVEGLCLQMCLVTEGLDDNVAEPSRKLLTYSIQKVLHHNTHIYETNS